MMGIHSRLLQAAALGSLVALLSVACGGRSITGGADEVAGSAGSTSVGGAASSGSAAVAGGSSTSGAPGVAGDGAVAGGCSSPQACGGSMVGSWSVTSSCLVVGGQLDLSLIGIGCATTALSGIRQVTGGWAAEADGTYTDHTRTTGVDKFELAAGCLAISGAQVTCDAIAPVFGGLGYNAVSCVPFREGSCSCSAYLDQSGGLGILSADPASSGKVIVSGDVITLDGQRTYAYCAAGEALTLMPQTVNPTITGTIELVAPL